MKEITAFVGHSFNENDSVLVRCFLDYLSELQKSIPHFSWTHAQDAAPKELAEKVMTLMRDKTAFIAICTKSERVVKSGFFAGFGEKQWKTSDWIIQEIGLAKGFGLELVLLVEEGLRPPGGLQGNLNYITFRRSAPEKAFTQILEMIRSLSPRLSSTQTAVSANPAPAPEVKPSLNAHELVPKESWTLEQYEAAFFSSKSCKDEQAADQINKAFLASKHATTADERIRWQARCEYFCLEVGEKDVGLARLKKLADDNPDKAVPWKALALGYSKYYDHADSGRAFEHAAAVEKDDVGKLRAQGNAAMAFAKDGDDEKAKAILDQMMQQVRMTSKGELYLLHSLRDYAALKKEDQKLIAIMERILEIAPDDVNTRFSLAHKHTEINNANLGLLHYLRIPPNERSSAAWNNLGVCYDSFDLDARAVTAYQKGATEGETLSTSNLAQKLIRVGFLSEAQKLCDGAIGILNCDKQIYETMSLLTNRPEEENERLVKLLELAKPIKDFYSRFGKALLLSNPINFPAALQNPDPAYLLEITLKGKACTAKGTYELTSTYPTNPFSMRAFGGLALPEPKSVRHFVEYEGTLNGCAFEGYVLRESEEERKQISSLLGHQDNKIGVLMIFSEDSNECHVMEGKAGGTPNFYILKSASVL